MIPTQLIMAAGDFIIFAVLLWFAKKVKIKGTVLKKVGNYAFYDMPENAVFTVPKAKKSAYKKLFTSKDTYGFKSTMKFKTF